MKEKPDFEFEFRTKHPELVFFALWVGLGEAMRMLAAQRGRDGWHHELYDTIMRKLESGDLSDLAGRPIRRGDNPDLDAGLRDASSIIDRAFDRLK